MIGRRIVSVALNAWQREQAHTNGTGANAHCALKLETKATNGTDANALDAARFVTRATTGAEIAKSVQLVESTQRAQAYTNGMAANAHCAHKLETKTTNGTDANALDAARFATKATTGTDVYVLDAARFATRATTGVEIVNSAQFAEREGGLAPTTGRIASAWCAAMSANTNSRCGDFTGERAASTAE